MKYVVAARSAQAAKTSKFPWEPATAAKTDVSVQVDKTCHDKWLMINLALTKIFFPKVEVVWIFTAKPSVSDWAPDTHWDSVVTYRMNELMPSTIFCLRFK